VYRDYRVPPQDWYAEPLASIDISFLGGAKLKQKAIIVVFKTKASLEDVMEDIRSDPERALLRKQLTDALEELNSATLQAQGVFQEYRSRAIPSPDGDLAFRKALRAETEARREYMRVVMAVHAKIMHSENPTEGVVEMVVKNSRVE
jgi:hypothetical protein